jgi:NAD(P)-dependent dehydrogenase (short-subunit alcohol dehydrogenase family)
MTQIAIITGAASGIGRALASALVARGDAVVVAGIDREAAGRVAGELARHSPCMATAAAVHVRDVAAVHALVHGTRDRDCRLDVMVNNAGIVVGLVTGCWDTVMAPVASRPGFGTADGGIAPAALPFRVKGARPWPR